MVTKRAEGAAAAVMKVATEKTSSSSDAKSGGSSTSFLGGMDFLKKGKTEDFVINGKTYKTTKQVNFNTFRSYYFMAYPFIISLQT